MVSKKLIGVGEVVRGQENRRLLRRSDVVSFGGILCKEAMYSYNIANSSLASSEVGGFVLSFEPGVRAPSPK